MSRFPVPVIFVRMKIVFETGEYSYSKDRESYFRENYNLLLYNLVNYIYYSPNLKTLNYYIWLIKVCTKIKSLVVQLKLTDVAFCKQLFTPFGFPYHNLIQGIFQLLQFSFLKFGLKWNSKLYFGRNCKKFILVQTFRS